MNSKCIFPIAGLSDDILAKNLRTLNLSMTPFESRRILDMLGRDPSIVELFIFDIEWSEHCSYKSSRRILKKYLPTEGPNVILGPGEDAGIVHFTSTGNRPYAIVIGHESHNHPSQILPVEGAATGIGGIVRDVDCMGAHVCAVADSLRFGDPFGKNKARSRWIATGVIDGIWQYGNALGVPNLCGEAYFDESFDDNCLVNVISLGIVPVDRIVRSRVPLENIGEDYVLVLVGKATDASGFGGVTFASEIMDHSEQERQLGAVQVHDPFLKNILIMRKANAMVIDLAKKRGIPIGLKDLGGGGLACASSEICAASGYGADIHLDQVHTSMPDLPPEVIACGETQERFIFATPESFAPELLRIYNDIWELPQEANGACARIIGRATRNGRYRIFWKDSIVCDAPIDAITAGIQYERNSFPIAFQGVNPSTGLSIDLNDCLLRMLHSVNGSSRHPIFRHYDTEVQGAAVLRPGEADAGVMAPLELIEQCPAAIALSVDGNPFIGEVDPYWGGAVAVAESLRNVIASGAIPRALTDCLNFGNPEKASAFWQFEESVRGIADAATKLWQIDNPHQPVPIVSGNVSFYNESALGLAIKPSPIVACLGVMDDYSRAITMRLKHPGNHILILGHRREEMGGSLYYRSIHAVTGDNPLTVDWDSERSDMNAVAKIAIARLALSCHDISDGGTAIALAEMCIRERAGVSIGASIEFDHPTMPVDQFLFCECGGFVLEIPGENLERTIEICNSERAAIIGRGIVTIDPMLEVKVGGRTEISIDIETLRTNWLNGLEDIVS